VDKWFFGGLLRDVGDRGVLRYLGGEMEIIFVLLGWFVGGMLRMGRCGKLVRFWIPL